MKKSLVVLFVCIFFISISGLHSLSVCSTSDVLCDHHSHDNTSRSSGTHNETNTDCPCAFHANGVIEEGLTLNVDFSLVGDLEEKVVSLLPETLLTSTFSFSFLLRAPPAVFK